MTHRRRRRAALALDPVMIVMSDVIFQLLVFALLNAAGLGISAVGMDGDVELPPGPGRTGSGAAPQVVLTVTSELGLLVTVTGNDEVKDRECKEEEMRRLVADALPESDRSHVLIRCDGRVKLKSVIQLQTTLRNLKFKKIEIAVTAKGVVE